MVMNNSLEDFSWPFADLFDSGPQLIALEEYDKDGFVNLVAL